MKTKQTQSLSFTNFSVNFVFAYRQLNILNTNSFCSISGRVNLVEKLSFLAYLI